MVVYVNRLVVWTFRLFVFIGLLSAVVTVIYLTPVPELQHASCIRPCHELDWPMICRVRLVMDMSTVLSRGHTHCPQNETDCAVGECVASGGSRMKILMANGQLPGPSIQVCENDILVVDLVNRVPGAAMTVHWRGQSQQETPYMDGAPMITQCPVNSFTTFQYKFRATNTGTHLWQVQTGNDGLDTLFGALIVRQAPKKEPHHELYDEDNHFILISELPSAELSTEALLLINGQPLGQRSAHLLSSLNVTAHKRHRLRIAYAVTSLSCPVLVSVNRHSLLIIAIDGHPIRPVETQSITLAPGERVDAVLTADQQLGDYLLTAHTTPSCPKRAHGSAVFIYQPDHSTSAPHSRLPHHHSNQLKSVTTVDEGECGRRSDSTDLLCLPKIQALAKLPPPLSADKLDFTLYLPFDFVKPPPRSLFDEPVLVPRLDNLTFTFPSSPLLSQWADVDSTSVCSAASRPAHCDHASVCECVHVIDIPLHSSVELVLIDQGDAGDHVFHLHGHSFHVVGAAGSLRRRGVEVIKDLDRRGQLFSRNLKNPIVKDTISVPASGVVAVRFQADNPGYWLLHDEQSSYWSRGLGAILHVGTSDDVPPVPEHFPTCGSWVGPEFFLI